MEHKLRIGILMFDEIEVLDFAGPFEVFSIAEKNEMKLCEVILISTSTTIITARNGLQVITQHTIENTPKLDVLIVPGGYGAEEIEIHKEQTIQWIKAQYTKCEIVASVCTGAFLLAQAKLLDSKRATTHRMDLDRLQNEYPKITVLKNQRYVDEGSIITSGGISSGIHMSLYLLSRYFGKDTANNTAKRMEFDFTI